MTPELAPIDAAAAPAFAALVLAPLRAALASDEPGARVAIGVRVDGLPAGAVVATLSSEGSRALVGSLVVVAEQRGRGLGGALLAELERELTRRGVREVTLRYAPGKPSTAALLRLLERRGFAAAGPVTELYRATPAEVARLPWPATTRLPASFTCQPLVELTAEERAALKSAPWYDAAWDPFGLAPEPRLALALRAAGEVVGWVSCSRLRPDVVLWHTLFIRRDLQASGVGVALCAEALRRAAGDETIARHDMSVDVANGPMQAFVAGHVARGVAPPVQQHLWRRTLPRPAPASPSGFASLAHLLRARAAAAPGRETFTYLVDGDWDGPREVLTLGELDRRARAVATLLGARCRPGDRAVLLHPPGLEFLAALFGCFYAGVVAVPAYPPANARHVPRLRAILSDSGAALVLTTARLEAKIAGWLAASGDAAPPVVASDELAPGLGDDWRERACAPDDVAILQYTSGSTATPRGVVVPHRALLRNLDLNRLAGDLSPATRFVSWLPHFHDFGLVAGLLLPLHVDGLLVLFAPAAFLQRPARWVEAMSRARATFSGGPDFAYDLVARRTPPEQRAALDLSPWEIAVNGSEPVRASTLDRFRAAFGPCGLRAEALMPCYGLAEATLTVTWTPKLRAARREVVSATALERGLVCPPAPDAPPGRERRELVSSGRPLGDLELLVVDPARGRACGPGEVGEVWVAGGGVAAGYHGRPDETARVFGARLAGGRGPYLRTGDLGFLRDGELFVTGRVDDLIIVRGRNHHPQDLEATVEAAHPALRPLSSAAIVLEQGDDEGEELAVLAEVERDQARRPDVASIAAAVRSAVAATHELELRALILLLPGALPRTSSGKTQRRAARGLLADGALKGIVGEWWATPPDAHAPEGSSTTDAAALERWLTARIGDALPGLDSLATVELTADLEARLCVSLPPTLVAEATSVAALARALSALTRSGSDPRAGSPGPAWASSRPTQERRELP